MFIALNDERTVSVQQHEKSTIVFFAFFLFVVLLHNSEKIIHKRENAITAHDPPMGHVL